MIILDDQVGNTFQNQTLLQQGDIYLLIFSNSYFFAKILACMLSRISLFGLRLAIVAGRQVAETANVAG